MHAALPLPCAAPPAHTMQSASAEQRGPCSQDAARRLALNLLRLHQQPVAQRRHLQRAVGVKGCGWTAVANGD